MRLVSLIQVLYHVVRWRVRRPAMRDIMLWHDAEFQILLRELRYAPIRRSGDSKVRIAVYRDPHRRRNRLGL
jgi:hypothetical protein